MKKIAIYFLGYLLLASCGKKPQSNFTFNPANPKAGEEVQFNNISMDAKSYDWNLGNMKISKEENPKNTYDQPGDYIVDLTAHNGLKSDTKTITISVIQ